MTFRKVRPEVIVRSKIMAVQAGLGDETGMTSKALEAHYLAGGNVPLVIRAIIAANKAKNIPLDFRLATAIDLAGRNVLEAVQTSVYPKVIDCPGANSGTRLARRRRQERHSAQGEGPRDRAGQHSPAHRRSDRRDDHRPRRRRHRQRDRLGRRHIATCWRIPTASPRPCWPAGSTRKRRSRSSRSTSPTSTSATTSAPGCRPTRPRPTRASPGPAPKDAARWPSPQEQENIAEIEESRAKVVEAEAEVPQGDRRRDSAAGKLGIMDYYKLRNVQADTDMRQSIAAAGNPRNIATDAAIMIDGLRDYPLLDSRCCSRPTGPTSSCRSSCS